MEYAQDLVLLYRVYRLRLAWDRHWRIDRWAVTTNKISALPPEEPMTTLGAPKGCIEMDCSSNPGVRGCSHNKDPVGKFISVSFLW